MCHDPEKGYFKKIGFFNVWTLYEKEAIKVVDEYVYIIKTSFGSKIGMSRTPEVRIKSIVGSLPFGSEYYDYFLIDEAREKEDYFHKKYREQKIKGEWFNLSDKDIEDIRKELRG